jgi:hypothetical protein
MKHYGENMVLAPQRAADLIAVYKDYIEKCDFISMKDAYQVVAESPARRFYVTAKRASIVIAQMKRGLFCGNPLKFEMYSEIYRRCLKLKLQHPTWTMYQLCEVVVQQPAPKFYILADRVQIIIIKARRQWAKEKLKRLRLYGCL